MIASCPYGSWQSSYVWEEVELMEKMRVDILIEHASQLLTLQGNSERPKMGKELLNLGIIEDGAVAVKDGIIVFAGSTADARQKIFGEVTINAAGKVVMPGFVDPHTHLVFGGSREQELSLRLKGASYMEILQQGGGIMSSVRATREATLEELVEKGEKSLDIMLCHGTTTAEAKSGYGLTVEDELKQLLAIRLLNKKHPVDLVSTFLGAHAIPSEYKAVPDEFVDLVVEEMLPEVARDNLAEFCDVFCEEGVFSVEQSRRILLAASSYGMKPKLHADELVPFGGAELAAQLAAVSADHLLYASEQGIKMMVEAGVIPVLLPGTPFCLLSEKYADARKMIALGAPVAIATDFNPGSCPTESMQFAMAVACYKMKMLPAEIISAATINAAHAIGRGREVGSLELGKKGDILIMDAPNYEYLLYHFGINAVEKVLKNGKIVVEKGKLV
jgi:imidazolonepropionase